MTLKLEGNRCRVFLNEYCGSPFLCSSSRCIIEKAEKLEQYPEPTKPKPQSPKSTEYKTNN